MPDTELRDLSETSREITTCPALVPWSGIDGPDGEPTYGVDVCGKPLTLLATTTIRGDDYGSFPVIALDFVCGHSVEMMRDGIRYSDYV